ncbi:winged helix-turn-helix domain-containing protein [Paraflavitalea pollutisoli]|uniref:winged helix-turn-helix domain-containing protein n=1 Tax=Paraflavitalea pollutisoli TaxID=3034143 RepID=UPI0023EBCF06|nr:winged helix-turn-helix domain-containing protein [Paraflavitalea sp. H1-2-19X]
MKQSISDFLKEGNYRVRGSLWIEGDGTRFWGPGPVELLGHIDATGSINQAAKAMGMSYKKAWEIVNRLNAMSKEPLVVTATGGEKGGGSALSETARAMIAYHHGMRERFQQFLEAETKRLTGN